MHRDLGWMVKVLVLPLLMRTTHGMAMTAMQPKPEDGWLEIEGASGSTMPMVRTSKSSLGWIVGWKRSGSGGSIGCWLEAEVGGLEVKRMAGLIAKPLTIAVVDGEDDGEGVGAEVGIVDTMQIQVGCSRATW